MTTLEPTAESIQEKRELLVWGAIPAFVGGAGLIVDGIYVISQYRAVGGFFPAPNNGATAIGSRGGDAEGLWTYLVNTIAGPMFVVGILTLILLALSRFGKKPLAVGGSVGLLVFAVLLLGYLIFSLVTAADTSIYSLVMGLLVICLAVAGVSGLMAQRAIVIK